MKRFTQSLWTTIIIVVPALGTIQSLVSGAIEYITGKAFFAFIFETPWRWIIALSLVIISLVAVFFYSFSRKFPGYKLKEAMDFNGIWIYFFPLNDNLVQDSVVEIRKRRGKHGDIPYSIAFVDRPDDNEKSTMLVQHLALYDENTRTYTKSNPSKAIIGKSAKQYYYRPYLSESECRTVLKGREANGNS